MNEIAEKLVDALSMFWSALDERERRLVTLGVLYVVAVCVSIPVQRQARRREREQLAAEVARQLEAQRGR